MEAVWINGSRLKETTSGRRQMAVKRRAHHAKGGKWKTFGGSRGWIAAGTLVAYSVAGGMKAAVAKTRKANPTGLDVAEATLPLKRFEIAAGPLDEAIKAYEKTTGMTVKIVLPSGTLSGFNSPGVVGLYREDEAVRLLLDG